MTDGGVAALASPWIACSGRAAWMQAFGLSVGRFTPANAVVLPGASPGELCELKQVAYGVVEYGHDDRTHGGGRLREGDTERGQPVVFGLHVGDPEDAERYAVGGECLGERSGGRVTLGLEGDLGAIGTVRIDDGEPAVLTHGYVRGHGEAELSSVEVEGSLLVVDEDAYCFEFHDPAFRGDHRSEISTKGGPLQGPEGFEVVTIITGFAADP